jgi:UDP-N-acetylmuramyl pentapeptide phosphotransferase/UDP-N-acetylglucosamine-1-phosphate transferase
LEGSVAIGLALTATLVLTAALGAPTRSILNRAGILDHPNQRSSHSTPTLRGGGVACWAACILVAILIGAFGGQLPLIGLGAATVLGAVGFLDDVRSLPPLFRLGAQATIGFATGLIFGGIWSAVLGLIAFPIVVNAVNFMDGINGISSLTLAGWGGALLIGSAGLLPGHMVIPAMVVGAALGFLPWNLPRARMFLGDSGSYFFGAMVASVIVSSNSAGSGMFWSVAGGLSLYFVDTCYTLLRRARRREPLLHAHREHLYQRLQNATNWPHSGIAVLMGAGALITGLAWTASTALGCVTTVTFGIALVLVTEIVDGRLKRPRMERL